MTTVEAAGWLDRLVQDIAHADANSLHAVRTSLAEVAGSDPDTAVASVVKQLSDVRQHLTAVADDIDTGDEEENTPPYQGKGSGRCSRP